MYMYTRAHHKTLPVCACYTQQDNQAERQKCIHACIRPCTYVRYSEIHTHRHHSQHTTCSHMTYFRGYT